MKIYWLIGACLIVGCSTSNQVSPSSDNTQQVSQESYNCTHERVYAALLSTRIHRLSGENPVVGVFNSRDGGVTWTHTGWPQGRHFAVVTEPSTCGVVRYVAAGNGLFRTTDDGATWRITTDWRQTEIQDIGVNTMDPRIILSATPYGIFRSTNKGDTWTEASTGLDQRFVSSVRFDRTNVQIAIAGTESGVYTSSNGGQSWQSTNLDNPVRSVRQHPKNPMIWIAGLQNAGSALSTDNGKTWTLQPAVDGKTFYEIEFGFSENELWAGGWEVGVWYSPDLGTTWEERNNGITSPFIHSLAISREHPGRMWAGSMGGGLFRSENNGQTWVPANPDLFDAGQIWDLFIDIEQ